jgi:hypothetical protein
MLTKQNKRHFLLATIILVTESRYNSICCLPYHRLRFKPTNAPASSFTLSPAQPTLHSTSDISGTSWLIVLIPNHPDYNHEFHPTQHPTLTLDVYPLQAMNSMNICSEIQEDGQDENIFWSKLHRTKCTATYHRKLTSRHSTQVTWDFQAHVLTCRTVLHLAFLSELANQIIKHNLYEPKSTSNH